MGNVLEAQGRFDESLNFHQRCLKQFTKVLGLAHHRVGDIYHKMAGHCIRTSRYKQAEYVGIHDFHIQFLFSLHW